MGIIFMCLTRGLHVMGHVKQVGWCPAAGTPDGKRQLLDVLSLPLLCCFCQHTALDNGWCGQRPWQAVCFYHRKENRKYGANVKCWENPLKLWSLRNSFGSSEFSFRELWAICCTLATLKSVYLSDLGLWRLSVRLSRWCRGICKWGAEIKKEPLEGAENNDLKTRNANTPNSKDVEEISFKNL